VELGLADKVAVVTGGSKGIGRSVVLELAAEGCKIAFSARGADSLEATARDARELGAVVLPVAADMTNGDDVERLIDNTVNKFGGIDILVNNVGGSRGSKTWEAPDEDWDLVFDINLFAAVRTTRLAIPLMRERGGGRVINISSIYGRESGGSMTYNSSKASMISWSKSLARQLAQESILVNVVAPGSIYFPGGSWERRQQEIPEYFSRFIETDLPLGRFGCPEEVSAMVAFLASERASLMTGACINVDGGQSRSNI